MITGEIGPDIVEMAGKAGISRILYKPPNIEKLLATIRHFSVGGVSYGKITACG
jgi:hypothetical protein